ncbi:MAG: homoserine O-acetyltransferase [Gammaproteobacteria bacterium]|nr:homoserine O-acetyltransferase [Gammaproteobacteria bacterium]
MADAINTLNIDSPFEMYRGGALARAQVVYETLGELNAKADNGVLVFTGLSPSSHVASTVYDPRAGWWEDMVGPEKPIDTHRFFVICVNSIGSCFGSTGPASDDPATGKPYETSFPVLSIEDIAAAGNAVVESMGIDSLAAVVGPSMGGMTALAFALAYPDKVRNFASISSAARALPFAIAIRSLQREVIRSDPAWRDGNYGEDEPVLGMRLARKLGMLSYRSAHELQQRFGRERVSEERRKGDDFGTEFEVESYLEAHAEKFVGTFDANCYLYLSRAMDFFDAADHGGSLEAAFARISLQRALVVGVRSDILFPLAQQQELAELLKPRAKSLDFHALDSIQGHDSFLVDMDRFRPVVAEFFNGLD